VDVDVSVGADGSVWATGYNRVREDVRRNATEYVGELNDKRIQSQQATSQALHQSQQWPLQQFLAGMSQYYASEDKLVWHDAKDACHALGGDLVSVRSEEVNRDIHVLIDGE
jgi:hypothetical protein